MPIKTTCPHCEKLIDGIPEEYAGRSAKCPHCNERLTIPKPPAPIKRIKGASIEEQLEEYLQAANSVQASGTAAFWLTLLTVLGPAINYARFMPESDGLLRLVPIVAGVIFGLLAASVASKAFRAMATVIRLLVILAQKN